MRYTGLRHIILEKPILRIALKQSHRYDLREV
jgi:hypothetical protein